MKEEYKSIDPELLKAIKGDVWSIENMAAHGADGRGVEYIGSSVSRYLDNDKGSVIFDYYRDTTGAFWFENRAILPNGEIVSMDMYIFGRKIRKKHMGIPKNKIKK